MNNKNTTESKQKQEEKEKRQIRRQARRRKILRQKARNKKIIQNYNENYPLSDCKPSGRICRNPVHELPKQLTTTEQAIFNNILCTTTNNAYCYKRQDTIAKEVGCCVKTVGRTYKILKALGLINYKKQGYKATCLVKASSWFYDFTTRNKLSKLFPALKYLPLFAITLLNAAKASIPENVPQDILRECLFKNYTHSRRHTSEFKNLRSITSELLKPSKNSVAASIFKKTLKREKENVGNENKSTMPVLFPVLGKEIIAQEKALLYFRKSIIKWDEETISLYRQKENELTRCREELQKEVEKAKSLLTSAQNNSKISDSNMTDGQLAVLKRELEDFRISNKSSWTMDKINLYMDFRAAIYEIEKSLPPFDDEKIMVMRKRLDSCIKKDTCIKDTGIKGTGRTIQQDYKCLAAGDDTHRR